MIERTHSPSLSLVRPTLFFFLDAFARVFICLDKVSATCNVVDGISCWIVVFVNGNVI